MIITTFYTLNVNAFNLLLLSRHEANTSRCYFVLQEVFQKVFVPFGISYNKFNLACQTAHPTKSKLPRAGPDELRMAKRHCGEGIIGEKAPHATLVSTKVVARVMHTSLKAVDVSLDAALKALHTYGTTNLLQLSPQTNALPAALAHSMDPESELPPTLPTIDFSQHILLQSSRYGLEATAKERWEHPALQHELEELL